VIGGIKQGKDRSGRQPYWKIKLFLMRG